MSDRQAPDDAALCAPAGATALGGPDATLWRILRAIAEEILLEIGTEALEVHFTPGIEAYTSIFKGPSDCAHFFNGSGAKL